MDNNSQSNDKPPIDESPPVESKQFDKLLNPQMSTNEAYFALLRAWVQQAQMTQNVMQCFPYYLMANYPQMFHPGYNTTSPALSGAHPPTIEQPAPQAAQNRFNRFRRQDEFFDNAQRQEDIINRNGGYEFVIAPLWKRFVAELIDVGILFAIKLLITFTIVDLFDLSLGVDIDFDAIRTSLEDDYSEFLSLTSELLFLEVITKIAVCFYEAMWTFSGQNIIGGATPGKMMMGIRIIHVDAVVPLEPLPIGVNQPLRALLYPASNPGFKRALCRAGAKNLLMALLFPMCFVMFFFKHNRTGYDLITKTIVVEENIAPILRRT